MEESLGLGPHGAPPATAPVPAAPPTWATENMALTGDVDDEVTLGGDDPAPPSTNRAPPVWPGDDAVVAAGEADRDIPDDHGVAPSAERRLVPSRHCPDGHPNPPLAEVCRACEAAIDAAAPTLAVPQPELGRLLLVDGEAMAIDRALVLGRRPDATVAAAAPGSRLISIGSDATISRTHAVVRADGWTVTVTDCGSRSGTAVLMPGGDEPLVLQPWIPHEVTVGARIFLGGPTSVSVEPVESIDGFPP